INLARLDSTGYSPFFLNSGRLPRAMIWNALETDEYPSVHTYAQRMKAAVMAAHDLILEAQVKQTRSSNQKCQRCPFHKGDLAYISTKN
ncbi:hypothetical protein BDN67DRAFT_866407, partial [Paxillus ammoniavirescens]